MKIFLGRLRRKKESNRRIWLLTGRYLLLRLCLFLLLLDFYEKKYYRRILLNKSLNYDETFVFNKNENSIFRQKSSNSKIKNQEVDEKNELVELKETFKLF